MNIGVQQELIGHGEQVRYRRQQQQQNIGYQPQRQQENIVRPVVPPAHDCPRSSSISLFIAIAIIVALECFCAPHLEFVYLFVFHFYNPTRLAT